MGVVHGLELDPGVGAVEGSLIEQVFQRLQNLFQKVALNKTCLKHLGLFCFQLENITNEFQDLFGLEKVEN